MGPAGRGPPNSNILFLEPRGRALRAPGAWWSPSGSSVAPRSSCFTWGVGGGGGAVVKLFFQDGPSAGTAGGPQPPGPPSLFRPSLLHQGCFCPVLWPLPIWPPWSHPGLSVRASELPRGGTIRLPQMLTGSASFAECSLLRARVWSGPTTLRVGPLHNLGSFCCSLRPPLLLQSSQSTCRPSSCCHRWWWTPSVTPASHGQPARPG